MWPESVASAASAPALQSLALRSSEAEARTLLAGFQWMAFTSSACPAKVRTGVRSPSAQSEMVRSLLHAANWLALAQSTSRMAAVWKANVCVIEPVAASHTIAVLSTAGGRGAQGKCGVGSLALCLGLRSPRRSAAAGAPCFSPLASPHPHIHGSIIARIHGHPSWNSMVFVVIHVM